MPSVRMMTAFWPARHVRSFGPEQLTPARRREVARFFRENPVPSGERALRQSLERFDWYRGFRRRAAREITVWLESQTG